MRYIKLVIPIEALVRFNKDCQQAAEQNPNYDHEYDIDNEGIRTGHTTAEEVVDSWLSYKEEDLYEFGAFLEAESHEIFCSYRIVKAFTEAP